MPAWFHLLPRELPLVARMVLAYADLFRADLRAAGVVLERRLWAAAVSFAAGLLAAFTGIAAVTAATWDTPHRVTALAILGALLVLVTIVAAQVARRPSPRGAGAFGNVRGEWAQDRELIARMLQATTPPPESEHP